MNAMSGSRNFVSASPSDDCLISSRQSRVLGAAGWKAGDELVTRHASSKAPLSFSETLVRCSWLD